MKRHPALIPLSRDHHDGLVQASRLRRAEDTWLLCAAGFFVGVPTRAACAAAAIRGEDAGPCERHD